MITCVPNFPDGKVHLGYKNRLWQTDVIDGIKVIRVWSYIAENKGFTKRILDYVSFMLASFISSFFIRKVDLVIGTSPQFFAVVSAWMVSGFKKKPFIFELRDIWPESIRAVGAMKDSRLLEWFEKLELFLYRRADAIIAVSESFRENLVKRGISCNKIYIITNGVDLKKFYPRQKNQALLDSLNLNGKFIIGYVGTHGMAHSLNTLLNSAKILKKNIIIQKYNFFFLGSGAERVS